MTRCLSDSWIASCGSWSLIFDLRSFLIIQTFKFNKLFFWADDVDCIIGKDVNCKHHDLRSLTISKGYIIHNLAINGLISCINYFCVRCQLISIDGQDFILDRHDGGICLDFRRREWMRHDNSWIYNLDWLGDGFDDSLRVVNDIDLPIIFEGSCKPENPPCCCP